MKNLKFSLPDYFGFEGASILLRDVKTNLIFTINEITKENRIEIKSSAARHNLTSTSGFSDKHQPSNSLDEEVGHEMRETVKITFPNNQGLTGKVFHSTQIYYTNNMNTEHQYQSDIDNLSGIKEVRNIMIGPVFSHIANVEGE